MAAEDLVQRAQAAAQAHADVASARAWRSGDTIVVAVEPVVFASAAQIRCLIADAVDAHDPIAVAVGSNPPDPGPAPADLRDLGYEVSEYVAPVTPIEGALCHAWGTVLGCARVGAHDDFLDLGGESLLAIEIQALIEERWAVQIPLEDVFELGTPARVAQRITELIEHPI